MSQVSPGDAARETAADRMEGSPLPARRILHLEDNPLDAELIQRALDACCPECEIVWARSRQTYLDAIGRGRFDLIICDYNLPDYDGLAALEAARQQQPRTPVIMVTGTLNEDEAVDCIRAGAVDYLLKNRLQRLGPAVERALNEVHERRRRRRAEDALRISEERLQIALEAAAVSVWEYDVATGHVTFLRQIGPMLGYRPGEVPGGMDAWEALAHPADVEKLRAALARHIRGESSEIEVEYRVRTKGGEWRWLRTVGRTVSRDGEGRALRISGTHMDVTERRRIDEMLRLQERAVGAATNAVVIVDARGPDYPIVHVNPAFERITGYTLDEVRGRNCRVLQGRDLNQPELDRLRRAVALGTEASALLRNYRKDGTLFWNNVRISPVRDAAGVVTHFVGIQTDVTELKRYQAELEVHANYDTLTGLANRNLLCDRLDHAIAYARRTRAKLALLCLELDGPSIGDEVLKVVGDRLRGAVRESDTIARLEGGAFAAILREMDEEAAAATLAGKLLAATAHPVSVDGIDVPVTMSVGIAVFPADGAERDTLLAHAQTAMHRAKDAGRNRVRFYAEAAGFSRS